MLMSSVDEMMTFTSIDLWRSGEHGSHAASLIGIFVCHVSFASPLPKSAIQHSSPSDACYRFPPVVFGNLSSSSDWLLPDIEVHWPEMCYFTPLHGITSTTNYEITPNFSLITSHFSTSFYQHYPSIQQEQNRITSQQNPSILSQISIRLSCLQPVTPIPAISL